MTERVVTIAPGRSPALVNLHFGYDPELVDIVKQVPGRIWDKHNRRWELPLTPENIRWLRARLPANVTLRIDPDVEARATAHQEKVDRAIVARDRGDSAIEFEYRTEPYAHQRAGLEFLTHIGSGALLWEMGLGKTKTAIDYAEWLRAHWVGHLSDFRVLVICPNTVKRNWMAELVKHAGHNDYVLPTGTLPVRAKQVATARYTIVNCEALSYKVMAEALRKVDWDLVILDESTRFKSPRALRTRQLHQLKAKHRIILTGTPITNSAEDAWAQYHFIEPGLLGSHWSFSDRYLDKDRFGNVEGVRPHMEKDLAERIGSRSYRILKREVIDLPEKVYSDRVVELTDVQRKAYNSMRDELRVALRAGDITAYNSLTQLLRLTQITAGLIGEQGKYEWIPNAAKAVELDALINEELRGEQVVIFGLYQRELEELAARYTPGALRTIRSIRVPGGIVDGNFGKAIDPTVPLPIIYGPTPEGRRHELVERFQRGDERLLFAQTRTGGIGINLTAAQTAIYHTRGWSLEEYLQSQDRLHRIGQTGTVSIIHLVADDTIDERIAKALAAKQNLADTLTGDDLRRLAAEVLGD